MVILLVHEGAERTIGVESSVEVVEDEAELPAVNISEALGVVLWPIPVAQIQLYRHIVDVVVDVQHPAYLVVGLAVSCIFGEHVHQFVEGVGGAAFLDVA